MCEKLKYKTTSNYGRGGRGNAKTSVENYQLVKSQRKNALRKICRVKTASIHCVEGPNVKNTRWRGARGKNAMCKKTCRVKKIWGREKKVMV